MLKPHGRTEPGRFQHHGIRHNSALVGPSIEACGSESRRATKPVSYRKHSAAGVAMFLDGQSRPGRYGVTSLTAVLPVKRVGQRVEGHLSPRLFLNIAEHQRDRWRLARHAAQGINQRPRETRQVPYSCHDALSLCGAWIRILSDFAASRPSLPGRHTFTCLCFVGMKDYHSGGSSHAEPLKKVEGKSQKPGPSLMTMRRTAAAAVVAEHAEECGPE